MSLARLHRGFATTARAGAAAAVPRRTVARTTRVPSRTSAAAPAAATPAAPAPAAPAAGPAAPPASFDDFDDADFALPEPEIGDYAHLRRPAPRGAPTRAAPAARAAAASPGAAAPVASPPLTALPDASYVPLPSASLGATGDMRDAYVFQSRLPGELAVQQDWTTSFSGLSERPFDKETAAALLKPLEPEDVEMKPDGLLYLPEIKYRRTLNAAFGPGGWGMAPRGETHVGPKIVSREWGLVCLGRLVAIARGEQEYFDPSGVPTATEACKSNALMRCCKDLGVASELWDPRFIREFKAKYCVEVMVEHVTQKKKRKLWRKKDGKFDYPYKEIGPAPK